MRARAPKMSTPGILDADLDVDETSAAHKANGALFHPGSPKLITSIPNADRAIHV